MPEPPVTFDGLEVLLHKERNWLVGNTQQQVKALESSIDSKLNLVSCRLCGLTINVKDKLTLRVDDEHRTTHEALLALRRDLDTQKLEASPLQCRSQDHRIFENAISSLQRDLQVQKAATQQCSDNQRALDVSLKNLVVEIEAIRRKTEMLETRLVGLMGNSKERCENYLLLSPSSIGEQELSSSSKTLLFSPSVLESGELQTQKVQVALTTMHDSVNNGLLSYVPEAPSLAQNVAPTQSAGVLEGEDTCLNIMQEAHGVQVHISEVGRPHKSTYSTAVTSPPASSEVLSDLVLDCVSFSGSLGSTWSKFNSPPAALPSLPGSSDPQPTRFPLRSFPLLTNSVIAEGSLTEEVPVTPGFGNDISSEADPASPA